MTDSIIKTTDTFTNTSTDTFLAIPSGNGDVRGELISSCLTSAAKNRICVGFQKFSKLTQNFNSLLCAALNRKVHTHFAMIHSDVFPDYGWLSKMHEIMAQTGADILSAVIPLKDNKGLTSTGLCKEETVPLLVKRYTLKEIHALPETFTHEHLVVNTGLMLINLKAPFISMVGRGLCFRVTDQIIIKDGSFKAYGAPEDWLWSLDARGLGAKIYATRAIKVKHIGASYFSNSEIFGVDSEGYNLS